MSDVVAGSDPAIEPERRRPGRRRSLLGGTVVFRDGSRALPCIVHDRTEQGGRIEVAAEQPVPKRFYLLTSKDNYAYDAELAWRKGNGAGLLFRDVFDISVASDPEVQFLKRIKLGAVAKPTPRRAKFFEDDSRWPV